MNETVVPIPEDAKQVPFGQILLALGKLTPQEHDRVLRLQALRGQRFGQVARSLALISEADVQEVLARQFKYRYLLANKDTQAPELLCATRPTSAAAESIRAVRSHLEHRWFAGGSKALAIVSVGSDEGASVFAANLAIAFSQAKKNTVLLDANLRCPSQQELFNLKIDTGLSQSLADGKPAEIVCAISDFPELCVVPAGSATDNANELVAGPAFRALQDSLVRHFDRVLIDCPAFELGADAFDIIAQTQGVLLVVRRDHTDLRQLHAVTKQLRDMGATVVGSVLLKF